MAIICPLSVSLSEKFPVSRTRYQLATSLGRKNHADRVRPSSDPCVAPASL